MNSLLVPVDNIQQRDKHSCWLAASQSLIKWQRGSAPTQRQLAAKIGARYGSAGSNQQVSDLLTQYAGMATKDFSNNSLDACVKSFTRNLPILVSADVGHDDLGHLLVFKGLAFFAGSSEPLAIVNDPGLSCGYSLTLPFSSFVSSWRQAYFIHPAGGF